jgi:hypothetical protein
VDGRDQATTLLQIEDRSAHGTSASVGRAERITRGNSRDWPGWPQLATAIIGLLMGLLVPACCAIVLSPCATVN